MSSVGRLRDRGDGDVVLANSGTRQGQRRASGRAAGRSRSTTRSTSSASTRRGPADRGRAVPSGCGRGDPCSRLSGRSRRGRARSGDPTARALRGGATGRVRLVVVGEPFFAAARHALRQRRLPRGPRTLATELGVADGRFLGEREDVPELLAAADLALVPSWEEPFGRVVLEAMAMAVPVVATGGGPAELLAGGRRASGAAARPSGLGRGARAAARGPGRARARWPSRAAPRRPRASGWSASWRASLDAMPSPGAGADSRP